MSTEQTAGSGRVQSPRPRLLDLFCCAGGAAKGYANAGFEVVGVDIKPQPRYPFEFHQADALEYVVAHGSGFDVIHASPPCQGYLNLGAVNRALGRAYEHSDLIAATRDVLVATGKPYVIENVADARRHLRGPVRICGTGLNLPLRRHRLFESNVTLDGVPCAHGRFTEPRYWTSWRPGGEHRLSTVVQVYGNAGGREHWSAAMGIDWMTSAEMIEAIPPAYTEWIGRQLIDQHRAGGSDMNTKPGRVQPDEPYEGTDMFWGVRSPGEAGRVPSPEDETAECVCCGAWLDGERPPYCRDCHAKGCP